MKYGFYSKNDHSKEIISIVDTESKVQAINYFAQRKLLNLKDFKKLYQTVEIKS